MGAEKGNREKPHLALFLSSFPPFLLFLLPLPLPPHLRWKTQKENEPGPRSGEPQPAGLE